MVDLQSPGSAGTDVPVLDEDRPVAMYPLTYLDEGDEVTVGRLDEGGFVVLPKDGAELLRVLENGTPPKQAAQWYLETYGESVDISDFVADLAELGFVRPPGEASVASAAQPVRWTRLGRAVYSPVGIAVYLVVLAVFLVEAIRTPGIAPTYSNLFFTQYTSLMLVVTFLGQMPLILLHEAAHTLAGRRLGLRSKLSIGRRLYFVVFQTTMDGLVTVPRRKRVLPILAGIYSDVAVLAVLSLFAAALRHSDGSFPWPAAVALALAYMTLLRIVWQCWFFLQTDIYYLVVTVLGCVDLHTTAKQVLSNAWRRLTGRPTHHDPQSWHPRDRRAARWYSALMVLGYGFAIITLAAGVIPAAIRIFSEALGRFVGHGGDGNLGLVDSVVFLILSIGEVLLAVYLFRRERQNKRAAASAGRRRPEPALS
ncbi:MAG TPA: hypothetical protein VF557_11435 [Jatrophihabitans sp.]|jgi:hypothetical protein|uniref:hypothetical protein n=1 Tax=Jatrophihabitans sp. TaxID=1932789 RepID=UPI002F088DBB